MTKIIGIAGSLRQHSYNGGLLRAAAEAAPGGCSVDIGSIAGIPLYNSDLEDKEGIPETVTELKEQFAAADGIVLVTPEYNNSLPGVFKNAIDWISRPPEDRPRVFGNKPVALMGATPGSFGTAFSQYAWLPTLRALGTQVWSGDLVWVSGAMGKFDKNGNLTDDGIRNKLQKSVAAFAAFVERMKA